MAVGAAMMADIAAGTVHIDTSSVGPEFDGLGGCRCALRPSLTPIPLRLMMVVGASAGTGPRLLPDYPEPARSDLLDFLFLPNHGASLSIIKLEIGVRAAVSHPQPPPLTPPRARRARATRRRARRARTSRARACSISTPGTSGS